MEPAEPVLGKVVITLKKSIQVLAIRCRQGKHVLYQFAVDGAELEYFTTITRATRHGGMGDIDGYQRPEIQKHIREISTYLRTPEAMLPNPLVVAFDPNSVLFEPMQKVGLATVGTLTIPLSNTSSARCGFVVDGQQRRAAIRESQLTGFPVLISAFASESEDHRRDQFILVNSTKPLPRTLILELLPGTKSLLPPRFAKYKECIVLLERLNRDTDSPLRMLICTPTMPGSVVKDNSLLKGIRNSLSDGVLYNFRGWDGEKATLDVDAAATLLKTFWGATSKVFSQDWAKKPRYSRLLHGAGVVALSFLMDSISDYFQHQGKMPDFADFVAHLTLLKPHCCWSSGTWWFGRKYCDIQNTPKDVTLFVNQLLRRYREVLKDLEDVPAYATMSE